ncbi:hypothetical protein WH43_16815 [Rheinheimera sp. KL1]|uniref:hypothetical protein n=1 Tax=Rheinheimera sp. KL1 TaxID=1635005 RepID=UPI0006A98B90|nr:hypothetical protein [Rheinheimera sp. KL1]KOO57099.1 hypothetical protein WH43_16815 [Rheinheimera sp. KL1]
MENYDDVLRFVSKVSDGELNYRSFHNDSVSTGHSKWHLLNEVANYKPQPVESKSDRVLPLTHSSNPKQSGFAVTDSNSVATERAPVERVEEVSKLQAADYPNQNSAAQHGFSRLFKKNPQPEARQERSVETNSLQSFFERVG